MTELFSTVVCVCLCVYVFVFVGLSKEREGKWERDRSARPEAGRLLSTYYTRQLSGQKYMCVACSVLTLAQVVYV